MTRAKAPRTRISERPASGKAGAVNGLDAIPPVWASDDDTAHMGWHKTAARINFDFMPTL